MNITLPERWRRSASRSGAAFGAGFLFVLLDQVDFPFRELRRVIIVGLGLVLCAPLVFTLMPPRTYPMIWPPYHPWLVQHMSRWLEERELMMSDMPWAVAWYGDRSCVWLSMDYQEEFYAISFNRKMKPVSALYITQVTLDEHFLSQLVDRTGSHPWGYFVLEVLRNNSIPTGFPLKYGWRNILPDQIFLADTARWNNPPPLAGKK